MRGCEAAAGEDRLRHAAGELPGDRRRAEEVGELRARHAVETGERDRREHLGAGDADARIGGHQALLGLDQVGPAQQQLRGMPTGSDAGPGISS